MGFGLIFMGWATLLFFKVLPIGIVGCILMLKGLEKLEGYGKSFAMAKNACIAFLAYFVIYGLLWTANITGIFDYTAYKVILYGDEIVYYIVLCVYSLFLYRALEDISKQTGFDKGMLRAKRASSLVIVFVLFSLVRFALIPFGYEMYLRFPLIVFELLWMLYTCMYLYSCYMMIATDEIIEEENRKMREYDEKYSYRTLKKNKKTK